MKAIAFIIILSIAAACNQHSFTNDQTKAPIVITKTDNIEIFGVWKMCAEGGSEMVSYNICPTIIFNNNGTGAVSHSYVVDEHFTWALKNGTLTIIYLSNNERQTFTDTTYSTVFEKRANEISLKMRPAKSDYTYYLSRAY